MTGVIGLVAFVVLVAAAAWAFVRAHARGPLDALVLATVWSAALTVACVTALSAFRVLLPVALLALAAVAVSAAWRFAPASRAPFPRPSHDFWTAALVALPAAWFAAVALRLVWAAPEAGNDDLAYHLPRLGYWIQMRAAVPFVAGNMRAGSMPAAGDVLALVPALFLKSDRACALVQLAAALLTSAAIVRAARALGATRLGAAVAGLAWLAIPSVLEQATWTLVDLVAAFFVTAAAACAAGRGGCPLRWAAALAAAALAVFTKTHVAVLAGPLALYAGWRLVRDHPRARVPLALGAVPAALLLGGAFHLQNAAVWGDPSGLVANRSLVVHPSPASFWKNLVLALSPVERFLTADAGPLGRVRLSASEPGLGIFFLAAASATAATLAFAAVRGERRALRPWLALAGLAAGGSAAICFALRHQPSQARYLLPGAALTAVAFAWTFDRLFRPRALRVSVAVLACVATKDVMDHAVPVERYLRSRPRYVDLQPLADAVAALPDGARVGVVTSAYFPEQLFFDGGYRLRIVPLTYSVPRTPEALAGLDALWFETRDCGLAVFRPAPRPVARFPDRSWRASATYDADFTRAYDDSKEWLDLRPTFAALAATRAWSVALRHPRGLWLVRGAGTPADPGGLCG